MLFNKNKETSCLYCLNSILMINSPHKTQQGYILVHALYNLVYNTPCTREWAGVAIGIRL